MKPSDKLCRSKASMSMFVAALAMTLFAFNALADVQVITKTVATGTASILGDNMDGARQKALKNALRQALEQGAGMVMKAESYVVNDDLKEKIYTNTQGYISGYEILKQGVEPNGEYRVVVETEVKIGEIKNTLDAELGLVREIMDYPRVLFLPSPREKISLTTGQAETVLVQHFTDRKFELVDPEMSSRLHNEAAQLLKINSLENVAATIGLKHQAEIVVIYSSQTGRGEFDGTMETMPVTLSAKAVETTTAQILTAQEKTRIGIGRSQDLARRDGTRKVGNEVSRPLMGKIVSWWADYTANGIPYTVTLQTPKRADRLIMAFQQALESIPGVVSLSERSSGGGVTEMMVKYKGSSAQFKREIFAGTENRRGFEHLHTTASKGRFLVFSVR